MSFAFRKGDGFIRYIAIKAICSSIICYRITSDATMAGTQIQILFYFPPGVQFMNLEYLRIFVCVLLSGKIFHCINGLPQCLGLLLSIMSRRFNLQPVCCRVVKYLSTRILLCKLRLLLNVGDTYTHWYTRSVNVVTDLEYCSVFCHREDCTTAMNSTCMLSCC